MKAGRRRPSRSPRVERVIEERARGDAAKADAIRAALRERGGRRHPRRSSPAREAAATLKSALIARRPSGRSTWKSPSAPTPRSSPRRRCCRPSATAPRVGIRSDSELEQPRARGGAGLRPRGAIGGRDAGQRRQPARLRGPLGAAAGQGQGQQRLLRPRALHPPVRRRLHPRRRPQRRASTWRSRGPDGYRLEGAQLDGPDQPRPAGAGPPGAERAPVSRRLRAVPRHDVRAHPGPRRGRAGVHPQGRRRGAGVEPAAGRAGQRGDDLERRRALDLRRRRPDAKPGRTRPPPIPQAAQ